MTEPASLAGQFCSCALVIDMQAATAGAFLRAMLNSTMTFDDASGIAEAIRRNATHEIEESGRIELSRQ